SLRCFGSAAARIPEAHAQGEVRSEHAIIADDDPRRSRAEPALHLVAAALVRDFRIELVALVEARILLARTGAARVRQEQEVLLHADRDQVSGRGTGLCF